MSQFTDLFPELLTVPKHALEMEYEKWASDPLNYELPDELCDLSEPPEQTGE